MDTIKVSRIAINWHNVKGYINDDIPTCNMPAVQQNFNDLLVDLGLNVDDSFYAYLIGCQWVATNGTKWLSLREYLLHIDRDGNVWDASEYKKMSHIKH